MVHECFYMPVCEKGWETLLYCVPQSRRWFNSFLHHSRCVLSAGWNRATSSAPKAGNLVPHLLLREPSHKNEGGRARVCLDLCKPSPPRKGGVSSRVQISFLICTYEGQELPIHGRQSIKSGSQSAFYFSLCWVLFPLKKKNFLPVMQGHLHFVLVLWWYILWRRTTCSGDVKVRGVSNYELMR